MTQPARRVKNLPRRRRGNMLAHLEARGWKCTRAGRWIDPHTGRSYTTLEAFDILHEVERRELLELHRKGRR